MRHIDQGASAYFYPSEVILDGSVTEETGSIELTLRGPPGRSSILTADDLSSWRQIAVVTNVVGAARLSDSMHNPAGFYQARSVRQ